RPVEPFGLPAATGPEAVSGPSAPPPSPGSPDRAPPRGTQAHRLGTYGPQCPNNRVRTIWTQRSPQVAATFRRSPPKPPFPREPPPDIRCRFRLPAPVLSP